MISLLYVTEVLLHPDTFRQLLFQLLWLFSDCWMFILDDLEDKLQASFPAGNIWETFYPEYPGIQLSKARQMNFRMCAYLCFLGIQLSDV